MASVTFPSSLGGDDSTITDDDNATTGLMNGGATIRLVPMISQLVAVCSWTVNYISTSLTTIGASISSASNSAAAALASKISAENSVAQVNVLGSATGLQTTGAAVMVNASTPPVANQIMIATSATTATWQDAPKTTPDFLLINAGII